MNDVLWLYVLLCLGAVFISSVSQVMLKKAAGQTYSTPIQEYLNPRVIFAYVLFVGTTFINVFAYRGMPLSLGPILETTAYIYITIFGVLIFKEKMNQKKWLALAMIVIGIIVYANG